MATLNQLRKKCRKKKLKKSLTPLLTTSPQRKGICLKIFTVSPRKPNSAVRKMCRVSFSKLNYEKKKAIIFKKIVITAGIPGQGHKLQKFSSVLVRGGRVRDVPGVRYKAIRGKYDLTSDESFLRVNARSKYGLKKLNNFKYEFFKIFMN